MVVSYNRMVDVLFHFTVHLAHIYIACVCIQKFTLNKKGKKKREEKNKMQTGKAVLLCT